MKKNNSERKNRLNTWRKPNKKQEKIGNMNKSHGERKNRLNMCLVLFFVPVLAFSMFRGVLVFTSKMHIKHWWYTNCGNSVHICVQIVLLDKFHLKAHLKIVKHPTKSQEKLGNTKKKHGEKKTGKIRDLVSRLLTSYRQSDDPSTKPAITGISWGYSGNAQTWWLSKRIFYDRSWGIFFRHSGNGVNTPG